MLHEAIRPSQIWIMSSLQRSAMSTLGVMQTTRSTGVSSARASLDSNQLSIQNYFHRAYRTCGKFNYEEVIPEIPNYVETHWLTYYPIAPLTLRQTGVGGAEGRPLSGPSREILSERERTYD